MAQPSPSVVATRLHDSPYSAFYPIAYRFGAGVHGVGRCAARGQPAQAQLAVGALAQSMVVTAVDAEFASVGGSLMS